MPNEVIMRSPDDQLTVQWGKEGDMDPAVILTSWRESRDPNGGHADWDPTAAWDLNRQTINQLIRVLRRARDSAYGRDE